MDTDTKFRQALGEESDFPLSDALYAYILDNSTVKSYSKGEAIINIGVVDPDVYIIKEGFVRGYILEDGIETNLYFGSEGTFLTTMHSFWAGAPSILCIEACCPSTLLRISKSSFDRMMDESKDFCRWVAGIFMKCSFQTEVKGRIMNGDARWRYEWLEKCRPELFDAVPLKAIASYLRMTEVHVSRIRNRILKGKGHHDKN